MWWPSSPSARDALVAGLLTVLSQVELAVAADDVAGHVAAQHLAFAVMTASTALRRTAPVTAVVVCSGGLLVQTVLGPAPVAGGFLALLLVVASMGYHASLRRGLGGMAAVTVGGFSHEVVSGTVVVGDVVVNAVVVTGCWLAAHAVRVSTDRRIDAEVHRDRVARDAAAAERTRIARDLHDSVSHALTVMTLHAGGARELAGGTVRESLGHIEVTGRRAVDDMHRILLLLGSDAAGAPGLADLETLVAGVAATGLDVRLEVDPHLGEVPSSIGTTIYRVVQEGLTNVLKHASARRAEVHVGTEAHEVHVLVRDDGAHPGRDEAEGSGRGLDGLRQRVELFGGRLETGPSDAGGWQVGACLPLAGAPA